uniref:Uncharacterized protein n=1 Tax=Tanacetum cinerariifolium TaxID=118510 RepID=A0A6L2MSA5_TANCI|nr:hypothetical protein [Tanacetum cinerariifolium]
MEWNPRSRFKRMDNTLLKQQILSKIDNNCSNDSINLICAGKVLKADDQEKKLVEFGVKNNSKILVTRVSLDHGKELVAEEEKTNRLQRLKAAATSLATRHADGSLPFEDFNLELENQSGEKVQLGSENDQRALMMGLMFHGKAKQLVKKKMYEDAVEVLAMGEESFSLCDSKVVEPCVSLGRFWVRIRFVKVSLKIGFVVGAFQIVVGFVVDFGNLVEMQQKRLVEIQKKACCSGVIGAWLKNPGN